MANQYIVETEKGLIKNKKGKVIKFDTEFEALNFIDDHNLTNGIVRLDEDSLSEV